jgi:hypothetical protein
MTTKRAVVEALVQGIAIEVQPDGAVCAHVRYRFGRPRVARTGTAEEASYITGHTLAVTGGR